MTDSEMFIKLLRKDFDDGIYTIINAYDKILNENIILRKENVELKSENYKDKELSKLRDKLRKIHENNDFVLDDVMAKKRDEFVESHCHNCDSYKKSWSYSYEYMETPVDDMVYIKCSCGEECYLGCV